MEQPWINLHAILHIQLQSFIEFLIDCRNDRILKDLVRKMQFFE